MEPVCMTILSAMATAIVAMAGWIVSQSREIRRLNEDRLRLVEQQVKMLKGINDTILEQRK